VLSYSAQAFGGVLAHCSPCCFAHCCASSGATAACAASVIYTHNAAAAAADLLVTRKSCDLLLQLQHIALDVFEPLPAMVHACHFTCTRCNNHIKIGVVPKIKMKRTEQAV
jgi:hypothetical protein